MKRLSIRARLTLWYTGILAMTLILLGGASYGLLMRGLWQDVDSTLEGVAKAVVQAANRPPAELIPPDLDEVLRRLFGPRFTDRFYQFLDPDGRLDPRWPRFGGEPLHVSPKALKNAAEGYATFETRPGNERSPVRVLTFPVMQRGRMVNVLQVGMSLEGLSMARQHFLWTLAALVPLALALAGTGGWLLARRALRPVDQMTTTARRIEAEHLGKRLDGAEVDDELGRLARTLNEMLARLEAAFAQVRRFSADASHELRTPLTVIKGEIEVALRSPRDSEEYQRVLASALEEVESMTRLVDDLLLLSRVDAGALRWEAEPVELDRLVEEAAKEGEILGRGKQVQMKILGLEPLIVRGDGQRLKQLLRNLVDNGVKYTPPGGRVALSLRRVEWSNRRMVDSAKPVDQLTSRPIDSAVEWAEIAVQDTGIGIPPEALPRIFDRFYRVDPARSREIGGAGLGLCIAQTIAEAHGGRIDVESTPGAGSTFTLRLPLSG
ncbi:MAG: HAMP domain-containing protein [candidate division NC10 bacterium]|nr:HAMP domain-containing protein [candidate division NC10 bacterium]MBI2561622.1 HAMP domain-containing protein [candidate division NC10 bacterium]MBI3122578.1 HAMP domain-containing protein [candidate division NC10 bacterium]